MFQWISRLTSPLLVLLAPIAALSADDAQTAFQSRVFQSEGKSLPYRIMFPQGFRRDQKYPLVLFLHGAGERGNDNSVQLVHGMNDFARPENREKYPCFVVAPQCPVKKLWADVDWSTDSHKISEKPSETMQLVLGLLDSLEREFPVDQKRLYVTGLSMGGYGTWDLVQRFPRRFAAAAPICGGGDETIAAGIVKVPIWAFHGDQDTAVKPERSRRMIEAITKAGGKPLYTEYKGVGHNSWEPAYRDPKLMEWLFAQKLAD